MGELGRRIVTKHRNEIVKILLRAYADEWFAHYNYQFVGHVLRGHHSPAVVGLLHRKSDDAWKRANRLAERLLQLGREPIRGLGELQKFASDKPFKLPDSFQRVDRVLKAVLDAERTSIRTYQEFDTLAEKSDPVSRLLSQDFLAQAVQGEEELERLIGETAPEMTGR